MSGRDTLGGGGLCFGDHDNYRDAALLMKCGTGNRLLAMELGWEKDLDTLAAASKKRGRGGDASVSTRALPEEGSDVAGGEENGEGMGKGAVGKSRATSASPRGYAP